MSSPRQSRLVRSGLITVAILSFALWLAWPALDFPWYYDDYHLIRAFSGAGLYQAFTGPWDVDDLEFRSYRPLMELFNHLRGSWLGEHVWMHRVLGVAICAICVSIACLLMTELGLGIGPAIGASLLIVASVSNTANLIWITDAAHALSAAFVLAGALVVLRPRFRWFHGLALYAAALAGMLVREDIAVLFSIVALVSLTAANRITPLAPINEGVPLPSLRSLELSRLLVTIACLAGAIVTYFALQRAMVPREGMSVEVAGALIHFYWTLLPSGTDTVPIVLAQLAVFAAALLGLPFLYRRNRMAFILVALLLAGVLLACLPGLLTQRMNLLLVPTLFYVFFLAACYQALSAHPTATAVRWGLAVVWTGWLGLCVHQSRIAQETAHPLSLTNIQHTTAFIYGEYRAGGARIPAVRQLEGEKYLARFGILSIEDSARFAALRDEALKKGIRTPAAELPFVPRMSFIYGYCDPNGDQPGPPGPFKLAGRVPCWAASE